MALNFDLSQVHRAVVAMGQDCNYQLDITKLGQQKKQAYSYHHRDGDRFPPDVTLGIQTKEFNLGFIRPENLVSHCLRVI